MKLLLFLFILFISFSSNNYLDKEKILKVKNILISNKEEKKENKKREKVIENYLLFNIAANDVVSNFNGLYGVELKSINNDLIIIGYKEDVSKIKDMLKKIDREKKQVLVKATIIETSSNLFNRIGLNWKMNENKNEISVQKFWEGKISLSKILELGGNFLGINLDYLKEKGELSLKYVPSILVLDSSSGEIRITEEIFLISKKSKTEKDIHSYEAGIIFNVKPKIMFQNNKEGVKLEIYSEISNFKATSAKQKNVLKTEVFLKDGESTFIGGMNQYSNRSSINSIPIIDEIPIFGTFFRKKNKSREKRDFYIELEVKILGN